MRPEGNKRTSFSLGTRCQVTTFYTLLMQATQGQAHYFGLPTRSRKTCEQPCRRPIIFEQVATKGGQKEVFIASRHLHGALLPPPHTRSSFKALRPCFLGLGFTVFTVPGASKQGLRPCTPAPAAGFRLRRAMLSAACSLFRKEKRKEQEEKK